MPPLPNVHRPLLGIALMIVACSLLSVMNAFAKLLAGRYPHEQLVWARFTSHLLWVLILFGPRLGRAIVRTRRPTVQILRSLAMLVSTLMFFFGLKHIPLAQVSVINFAAPFIVMLIAWPMLGERPVATRVGAAILGFAGVITVMHPGTDLFHWASIVVFVSAGFYALYQVLTREVAGHDRPETSILYSVLIGTTVMSCVVPWVWVTPSTVFDAVVMGNLGLLGALGHYFLARAMTYAHASVISPINYWQLVGAVGLGYALFGELPDLWTWTGAAMIVAAGIYLGWSESRAEKSR